MVSSDLGSVDLTDLSTGHTNGTHGHDVINDWIDIATRPASARSVSHSGAGVLSIDADAVGGGHTAIVTVGANITGLTITNITVGIPFLLMLVGNGSSSITADLSAIKINSSTTLSNNVAIGPTDAVAISFIKLPNGQLWAPGGLMVYDNVGGVSGITAVAHGSYGYTGSYSTTHSIPIPTGVVAGDFIEIVVQTQEPTDTGAPTPPGSGVWTQRFTNTPPFGYTPRLTKFYKFASGSEGGTNITLTFPVSTSACGGSQVWRGVNATTPYDTAASSAVTGNGNPNPPSRTPVTNNSVVAVYAAGNKPGGLSCTPPSGYTKTLDQSAYNRSMVIAYKLLATAAAEDPAAFAWATENDTVFTDVLRPA